MDYGVSQSADKEIVGLTADSRLVRPGYLFAALPSSMPGAPQNGADFVSEALCRGAVAILGPPGLADQLGASLKITNFVPVFEDDEPRRRLALLAARFFGQQPEKIIAVTGTSGKSSVVDFVRQIWSTLGLEGASLGTLGVVSKLLKRKLAHTTPDPVFMHKVLAELVNLGVDHLALEASSHGLQQRRLDGVKVSAAAFTNLSQDHLDYHMNEESYFQAKLRLFDTILMPGGTAVLPCASHLTERLKSICKARGHRILTFGAGGDVDLRSRELLPSGQRIALSIKNQIYQIDIPLMGAFQADNVLCAVALVLAAGETPEAVLTAAENLTAVKGRLQAVGGGVFVDYAHKPGALRAAITALRPYTKRQLIVLFGCGGDRDRGKRIQMGRIADDLADSIVVTDDNPRSEDPADIRAEILRGCRDAVEIGDRRKAIATAIGWLKPGDVLLIAGKGHETGQEIAGAIYEFDDVAVARAVLQRDLS